MKNFENHNYDIAVCGGGIAGISAALAAAREGKKVILFEKEYMLGGLGTAGLVTIYLPLCDGMGHQVSFGIAEELLRLSIKYGAEAKYPENWLDEIGTKTENDKRFQVRYNAQVFAILAEQLLSDTGVDIMYGSYVIGADVSGGRIKSLSVVNKSGITVYYVKTVVDATGDADIAEFSGAPTDTYKPGNIIAAWYYFTENGKYDLKILGNSSKQKNLPDDEDLKNLFDRRFGGIDAEEISEMVQSSHKLLMYNWLERRETDESSVISTIATIPQLRMTRKIVGEYTLGLEEMHKPFEDSIGMVSDWRKRGPIYEVPFGTLYNSSVKNLIMAGRCTSVTDELWDVMRVIPCCAVTGQAAGTAAAIADDFTAIDIKVLQKKLEDNGVVLHESAIIEN
jgi:hypothetical protein